MIARACAKRGLPLECWRMDALLERTFEAEERHFWFRGFKRFVAPLVAEAVAGRAHPRMLDAGCGTGTNLTFLRKYGRAYGLELSPRGIRFGRERGLQPLTQGSVTHLPFGNGSFDVVLSFDVLYCLETPDEQSALYEMFRVLKPGGCAVINVAALEILRGDHSALGGEVRRYTRRELAAKLDHVGFVVKRLTYTNASLFPIAAAVRALQRLRGIRGGAEGKGDFHVPPAPINDLFAGALTLESQLVKAGIDMPFGSSLLCLANKPA
jgi:SAM-dependent methyltransferase